MTSQPNPSGDPRQADNLPETGPKESTLRFLRQLARCYTHEAALAEASLGATILN